jgi:hypothetical protein
MEKPKRFYEAHCQRHSRQGQGGHCMDKDTGKTNRVRSQYFNIILIGCNFFFASSSPLTTDWLTEVNEIPNRRASDDMLSPSCLTDQ